MGEKYQLENDHVFPYSRPQGMQDTALKIVPKYVLAQEIANRSILTQLGNRKKGATSAIHYLSEVLQEFPSALEKQCIPLDQTLWEIDNYEKFLSARRQLLAERLNNFLQGLTELDEEEEFGAVTLEDRIAAEGESEELEFKSSLRWDIKLGTVNKDLQNSVLKTIAAFTNTRGGTLLVGVSDDGNALGLENDYISLQGNKDQFQLHLRNILNSNFDSTFVANHVEIRFPKLNDIEICQIEVKASTTPKMVSIKNKNGQANEKFYLRSGNMSQELNMSEFNEYSKERFR